VIVVQFYVFFNVKLAWCTGAEDRLPWSLPADGYLIAAEKQDEVMASWLLGLAWSNHLAKRRPQQGVYREFGWEQGGS
jgi:hypothetical protein